MLADVLRALTPREREVIAVKHMGPSNQALGYKKIARHLALPIGEVRAAERSIRDKFERFATAARAHEAALERKLGQLLPVPPAAEQSRAASAGGATCRRLARPPVRLRRDADRDAAGGQRRRARRRRRAGGQARHAVHRHRRNRRRRLPGHRRAARRPRRPEAPQRERAEAARARRPPRPRERPLTARRARAATATPTRDADARQRAAQPGRYAGRQRPARPRAHARLAGARPTPPRDGSSEFDPTLSAQPARGARARAGRARRVGVLLAAESKERQP